MSKLNYRRGDYKFELSNLPLIFFFLSSISFCWKTLEIVISVTAKGLLIIQPALTIMLDAFLKLPVSVLYAM